MRLALALLVSLASAAASAQDANPPSRPDAVGDAEADLARSAESRERLQAEIAALATDGPKLAASLVEAGGRARAAEERIAAVEERLGALAGRERTLRSALDERRDAIADLLAALQRLGRARSPALLLHPGDVAASLRAALLLRGLVPDLAEAARRLAGELDELATLRREAEAERATLRREAAGLAAERARIEALVSARGERLAAREGVLAEERRRVEALGRRVRNLKDLSDALGRPPAPLPAEKGNAPDRTDLVWLGPTTAFASLRGRLVRPAAGRETGEFGEADGRGGRHRGLSLATRPRALVTAPADARIVFAGPFRSFGRLLILDAGGGYYLLLAGMDRITVAVGQAVLAGEPVGQMGAGASAAAGGVEAGGPVLYVEFRKDGVPIDPGPWWAKSLGEKVRG